MLNDHSFISKKKKRFASSDKTLLNLFRVVFEYQTSIRAAEAETV